MSDGLRLLSSILSTGSVAALRATADDRFVGEELSAVAFVRRHYRLYGSLPTADTIREETGVRLPVAPEALDYYLRRIEDRYLYDLLRTEFDALKTALRSVDLDAARSVVDNMRRCTRHTSPVRDLLSSGEAAQEVLSLYDSAYQGEACAGVTSGWPSMDAITDGYQAGDLVTLVARPAQGKTYLLLHQAFSAWLSGRSVIIATMEMTLSQITARLLGIASGINPRFIRKRQLSTSALRRLREYADYLANDERMVLYSGGTKKSPSDLDILIQEYGPDCVYLDGVHMMIPDRESQYRSGSQRNERVSMLFDQLNAITVSRRIPIVNTTHLNRSSGADGRGASLETVAYSDAIGTHSSLVLSVAGGEPPYQNTRKVLRFLKGREGEEGSVCVNYTFSPVNFSEVPIDGETDLVDADGTPLGAGVDWVATD